MVSKIFPVFLIAVFGKKNFRDFKFRELQKFKAGFLAFDGEIVILLPELPVLK